MQLGCFAVNSIVVTCMKAELKLSGDKLFIPVFPDLLRPAFQKESREAGNCV